MKMPSNYLDVLSTSDKHSVPVSNQIKPVYSVQIIKGSSHIDANCLLDPDDHHVWLSRKQSRALPFVLEFKFQEDTAKNA